MNFILIEVGSPEWDLMWKWLEDHPINKGLENPTTALNESNGEAWMYMGSYQQDGKLLHDFKHRCHPMTNELKRLTMFGTSNLEDDQIKKSQRIR